MNINSNNTKGQVTQLTQFNKNVLIRNQISNISKNLHCNNRTTQSRSKTPIGNSNLSNKSDSSFNEIGTNAANNTQIMKKSFPKLDLGKNSSNNIIANATSSPNLNNTKSASNSSNLFSINNLGNSNNLGLYQMKTGTPKKITTSNKIAQSATKLDLKNFMMYNNQNNYSKKFLKKQSIENLNGISRKLAEKSFEKQSDKMCDKSPINVRSNQNKTIEVSDTSSSIFIKEKLNKSENSEILMKNANTRSGGLDPIDQNPSLLPISIPNNNANNFNINNTTNLPQPVKIDDRKLSILDVAGVGPLIPGLAENDLQQEHSKEEEKEVEEGKTDFENKISKSTLNKQFLSKLAKKEKFIYIFAHSE